jgi:hypothetical protein
MMFDSGDFPCSVCGVIVNYCDYVEHIMNSHIVDLEGRKLFKCCEPSCCRVFKNYGILYLHMRDVHKVVRYEYACEGELERALAFTLYLSYGKCNKTLNVPCVVCGQAYNLMEDHLSSHYEKLTDSAVCAFCDSSFENYVELVKHIQLVHDNVLIANSIRREERDLNAVKNCCAIF